LLLLDWQVDTELLGNWLDLVNGLLSFLWEELLPEELLLLDWELRDDLVDLWWDTWDHLDCVLDVLDWVKGLLDVVPEQLLLLLLLPVGKGLEDVA
jgi:hypothetical protein